MTDGSMALVDYLRKAGMDSDLDLLRESVRVLSQRIIEAETEEQIGAGKYERAPERTTYRNGYRECKWETRVGEIPLRIPRVRQARSSLRCWNHASGLRKHVLLLLIMASARIPSLYAAL